MILFLLALSGLTAGLIWLWRVAEVGAAYKAKILCSAIFVSGRELDLNEAPEVSADAYRILRLFRARLDRPSRSVTASFLGFWPRTAVFRPGLGATLALGPLEPCSASVDGERAEPPPLCAPSEALRKAVETAFQEPDPRCPRRTRAVVVLHEGRIAAERYAEDFTARTPLPGWSMTKSVLSALAGLLIKEGRLSLMEKNLLPEWSRDARKDITVEDLLRMRSGLEFSEVYDDPSADATRMLFAQPDAAAFAASKPLAAPPGTTWNYSSGTTNILSSLMRRRLDEREYLDYPRRALFNPLGMTRTLLEPDASGTFLASSFMFATAREWARFGQLYLDEGAWEGNQLLPEGWTRFCARPTPESDGRYGAHWWLKLHKSLGGESAAAERLPRDSFHACGHEGQVLTVIPSRRLVVARLGLSIRPGSWDHARFLAELLEALPA